MSRDMVQQLLDGEKWRLCADLAAELLGAQSIAVADRAFLAYALCRSRSRLNEFSAALAAGQRATALAEDGADLALLGKALLELAYVQGRTPTQEREAIETYRRFLTSFPHYPQEIRRQHPKVLFNLARMERTCNLHREALLHFEKAHEAARRAGFEVALVEEFKRNWCWQALQLRDFDLAARLIHEGEEYLRKHPQDIRANVHLLCDKAWYAVATTHLDDAVSLALEALPLAEKLSDVEPGYLTRVLLIWSNAVERFGDKDSATQLAAWAHLEAQRAERPELIEEVRQLVRGIRIEDREVADRFMATLFAP